MREIPVDIKLSLFEITPGEELSPIDQILWNDFVTGRVSECAKIDINDEEFWEDIQAYAIAEEDKNKLMQAALQLGKESSFVIKDMAWKIKSRWIGVAAAIVVVAFTLLYVFTKRDNSSFKPQVTQTRRSEKLLVLPNINKTVLTLSNNKEIAVNDIMPKSTISQGNAEIKNVDNQLIYETNHSLYFDTSTYYNTISTARGGQYTVTLSDGSKVWLNASSKLRYPATFKGSERRVQLTGEAYFEVTKNTKQPFRVEVDGTEIEVKGTVFNIKHYPKDTTVTTTLINGIVDVKGANKKVRIKPGEQAIVSDNNIHVTKQVLTNRFIAWKDKIVNLEGESIKSIMDQISRLYDVDYDLPNNLQISEIKNEMKKFDSLNTFLENLDLAIEEASFKLEGRRIIVRRQ